MKNLFAIAAVAAMLVACSGNNANNACCEAEAQDSVKCCAADSAKCCAAADSAATDSVAAPDSTAEAPAQAE